MEPEPDDDWELARELFAGVGTDAKDQEPALAGAVGARLALLGNDRSQMYSRILRGNMLYPDERKFLTCGKSLGALLRENASVRDLFVSLCACGHRLGEKTLGLSSLVHLFHGPQDVLMFAHIVGCYPNELPLHMRRAFVSCISKAVIERVDVEILTSYIAAYSDVLSAELLRDLEVLAGLSGQKPSSGVHWFRVRPGETTRESRDAYRRTLFHTLILEAKIWSPSRVRALLDLNDGSIQRLELHLCALKILQNVCETSTDVNALNAYEGLLSNGALQTIAALRGWRDPCLNMTCIFEASGDKYPGNGYLYMGYVCHLLQKIVGSDFQKARMWSSACRASACTSDFVTNVFGVVVQRFSPSEQLRLLADVFEHMSEHERTDLESFVPPNMRESKPQDLRRPILDAYVALASILVDDSKSFDAKKCALAVRKSAPLFSDVYLVSVADFIREESARPAAERSAFFEHIREALRDVSGVDVAVVPDLLRERLDAVLSFWRKHSVRS